MPKKKIKKKRVCAVKKGGRWEREISNLLSLWISRSYGDTRDDLLWRSAGSGSRATAARKKGMLRTKQAGDLSATDERAIPLIHAFMVEGKSYKDLGLEGLFWRSSSKPLDVLFDKSLLEAKQHGKWALLVFKQNKQSPLILMHQKAAVVATKLSGLLPDVWFVRQVDDEIEKIASFVLPDFLERVDFKNFITAVPLRNA